MAGTARISSETVFDLRRRSREMGEGDEHQNGPDDRQEKASRVEKGAILWGGKNTGNQSPDHRTRNSDECGHPKAQVFSSRNKHARNKTNDKADQN
jgi:hypothetical protein